MKATVSDLYRSHGLSLRKKGDGGGNRGEEWCGPCPGCGGDDRFLVWPRQNGGLGSYSCRQCGSAGDSIQFLRDFAGMSFFDASRAAGHPVPDAPRKSCPAVPAAPVAPGIESADPDQPSAVWSEKAGNFAAACHEALMQDEQRLAWLSARGLPVEAALRFRLGWNEGDAEKKCLIRPRKVWGLADVPAGEEGGKPKTRLWLPRGLVIPARDSSGLVVRLRIRRPEEDREGVIKAPYYVIPGSSKMPMLLEQCSETLPRGAVCLVVESDLDAEACAYAAGDLCAVLPILTANISKLPPRIMRFLSNCSVILVATDFGDKQDAKGSRAGAKGWEKWRATFAAAKRWPCVRGKDPGEMFAAGVSLRTWILAGLPDALASLATRSETPLAASSSLKSSSSPSSSLPPAPGSVRELCRAFREHPFSLVLKKDGGILFESPWSWRGSRHDLYGQLTDLALSAEVHDWLLAAFPEGGPVCDETLTEKIRISYAKNV